MLRKAASAMCISEDRPETEPGLRILISSIVAHSHDVDILVYFDGPPTFAQWASQFLQVVIKPLGQRRHLGWNVKPSLLLEVLDAGYSEVTWVDSDIVLARDWRPFATAYGLNELIATEEARWGASDDGHGERARAWSFEVARTLPGVVNTCFLRVTGSHRALLEAWQACLNSPKYQDMQKLPTKVRPVHFMGDQDVLTALLCSKEFSAVPIRLMRLGREAIQAFGLKGFTVAERLSFLSVQGPILVHQQGTKPWSNNRRLLGSGLKGYLTRCYLDASPYMHFARHHRHALADQGAWLEPTTALGWVLIRLGVGSYILTGLPLAIIFDFVYSAAKLIKTKKRPGLPPIRARA